MSSQRIALQTDWAAFSGHIPLDGRDPLRTSAPDGYAIERLSSTNVWGCRDVVLNVYGEKVLTILSNPISGIIDRSACLVEVANRWLYGGVSWRRLFRLMDECCQFVPSGLSRLDLAFDFVPTESQVATINALASGDMYVAGKRSGTIWWKNCPEISPRFAGLKIPHCQSWGSKYSNVKWKLYYKSLELWEATGGTGMDKPWIVDNWNRHEFDTHAVWRLEVSVHPLSKIMLRGEVATIDDWLKRPMDLARDLYGNYQVRKNEGHKDRSNDTQVEFLPMDIAAVTHFRRYDGVSERNGLITLLRQLIKSTDEPEVYRNEHAREMVLTHIEDIVTTGYLQRYASEVVGTDIWSWIEDVRNRAYEE